MHSFIFDSYEIDLPHKKCHFRYALHADDQSFTFEETLTFSEMRSDLSAELLDSVLHTVHLMLGISYWKLYCPTDIQIKTKPLSKDQAQFWNTVYTKGLGEFFFKNKIDFRNLIEFPYDESISPHPISVEQQQRALVGMGGGKDSIVTSELLEEHNKPFSTFIVETQRPHIISDTVAQKVGKDIVKIHREIDSRLFELNKNGNFYNGHIPISAIFAAIGVLTALLYDYSAVIVSNERSANYGNTEYLGEIINHQWSKTIEFEKLFQKYIKLYVTPSVSYFSLLRPFSEYRITEMFSKYPMYFSLFSSCNRNFTIHKEAIHTNWCGECPKCAFVFIMLAAVLSKKEVTDIFKKNLLDNNSILPTYKELLGVEGIKPFECVGTPEEVTLAFYKTYQKGEFNDSVIMKYFEKEVMPKISSVNQLELDVKKPGEHLIPDEYQDVIHM